MASSLIEQLPAEIARLETKFGEGNPFVKDLKEQLRASIANAGKSGHEVFRMQAIPVGTPQPSKLPDAPSREGYDSQEEYDDARGRWQDQKPCCLTDA